MYSACVLDNLPPEICERIAVFATTGRPTETALSLANVSTKQRTAVATVLSHTLDIQAPLFLQALTIFRSNVRAITISLDEDPFQFDDEEELRSAGLLPLFHAPNLSFAMVPAFSHILSNMQRASALQSLTLMPVDPDHTLLLDTLRTLPCLQKLHLVCDDHMNPDACIGEYLADNPSNLLPSCCPALKSLNIECTECSGDTMYSIMQHLFALRELFLTRDLPHVALPALRRLESVHISDQVAQPVHYAAQIGQSIASVAQVGSMLCDPSEVCKLAVCQNLRSLLLWLTNGSEISLLEIVPHLTQLRSLELHWDPLNNRTEYYRPRDGLLASVVTGLASLEELRLRCVAITIDELTEITRVIGKRMRVFHCPLRGQAEGEGVRMRDLLAATAKYNPNLRQLEMSDNICRSVKDRETLVRGDLLKTTCLLKEYLHLHAPLLDHSSIERHLNEFLFLFSRSESSTDVGITPSRSSI